jgi:hypothetical protein
LRRHCSTNYNQGYYIVHYDALVFLVDLLFATLVLAAVLAFVATLGLVAGLAFGVVFGAPLLFARGISMLL